MASRYAAAAKARGQQATRDKPKGPREARTISTGKALVKGVLSGDTLILQGASKPGEPAPPEKEVTLSGIRAPQFARGKTQEDHAWAWHSREFLRKKVLGRPVTFQILHTSDAGRAYCNVQFNGEELSHVVVANGWAKVQPPQEGKKVFPEKQALLDLENDAQTQGLGMHNRSVPDHDATRELDWVSDVSEFFEKRKNVPLPAVIDRVITGSVIRVEILGDETDPLKHSMINLHLAGVECPETPIPDSVLQAQNAQRKQENPAAPPIRRRQPAPFALEAQRFVENRLLHRDVKIVLQGTDKQVLFGTILFEKGNITEKLLEQGFGKYVKWTAGLTGAGDRLAQIESEAKARKAGQWQNYKEGVEDTKSAAPAEFSAKVIQVVSGDRFVIEGDKRFALASIRAPRFGARGDPGEPLGFEAREALRKAVVGKTCRIIIEYDREPLEGSRFSEKTLYVSLYHGKQNINEHLVEQGLAQVVNHKRNENRASNYERLVEKEAKALKEGKGKWAERPNTKVFQDLTQQNFRPRQAPKPRGGDEDAEKEEGEDAEEEEKKDSKRKPKSQARAHLERFKQNKQEGIVEYVFSATRYKILLERQGFYISFALSGIRSPPQKNDDGSPNPYANMALEFARERLLQRTVWVDIKDVDRGDNFLGTLTYFGAKEKENIGVALLRAGLAYTFGSYSNPVPPALADEEKKAKDAKLNYWKDYVEPVEDDYSYSGPTEETTEEKVDEKTGEPVTVGTKGRRVPAEATVRVTEVIDAATFYMHITTDESIQQIEENMKVFDGSLAITPTEEEVKNGIYAGLFRNDGSWHRVRLEGKSAGGKWRAFFIDYGNRDVLELEDIRVLDDDLAKMPGTALSCTLTGLKAPGERSEYFERAGQAFSDLVWDRQLQAKIDLLDGGKYYVTLKQAGAELTINQRLVQAGCVRIQDKIPRNKLFKPVHDAVAKYRELEENAKRHRRGIWEYGDVSDDEEEDDDRGRVPSKAAKERAEKEKQEKKLKEKELAAAKKKAEEEKASKKGDDKGKGKGKDKGGDKGKADDKGADKGKGGKKK